MQPVDYTTLIAVCTELHEGWLPARVEQVIQRDRFTICIALRTLQGRGWLTLSWHPQAARIHIDAPPPRLPDTFTFSQQLKHQLNGYALTAIAPVTAWERVLDLQFAQRPGDPIQWHLFVEIMGKYSNIILVNAQQQIVTAAHQVGEHQSSVRPILTGTPYQLPPTLVGPFPALQETQDSWQERLSLIPTTLKKAFFKAYSGLSSAIVRDIACRADLDLHTPITALSDQDWQRLFHEWQFWLQCLDSGVFRATLLSAGYSVLGDATSPDLTTQVVLQDYYTTQLNLETFARLQNQLAQRLKTLLKKLYQKAELFRSRLQQAAEADTYRQQADLLMAYNYQWQPGLSQMVLNDFKTGDPVKISLNPEKNAVQNAQAYYKQHQKLKRSRQAILPLLEGVQTELNYLEQVEAALKQIEQYETPEDLVAISEIRDELIQQGYLEDPTYRPGQNRSSAAINVRKFTTPSGIDVWVGRNNRQNDFLISHAATDYDLWFHTQEIPGSHVLLRLQAGQVPETADVQFAADVAAYFSRAQQADQVPVVYTQPQYVFKPKGARPGMVVYTHETVVWGCPQTLPAVLSASQAPPELVAGAR